jgi:4-hydroxy-tetrahydrodipicolinate synthase
MPRREWSLIGLAEAASAVDMSRDSSQAEPQALRGVWPIVTTPFDEAGQLDLYSLARVAEHVIGGGAHGLVYPAIASEFQTLTLEERRAAVEHLLSVVDRRLPAIVGVSSRDEGTSPTDLAEHAARCSAAAVMFMPPPGASASAIRAVLAAIADASDLPIILQNAPPPLGPALGIDAMRGVIDDTGHVRYVKEETPPCGQRITRLLAPRPTNLLGVFGGAGGRFAIDELARGALGSMPACEFTAIHVGIYERCSAGDWAEARRLFNMLLPLLNFESVFRTAATKQILHRLGVIASPRHRDGNPQLDDYDRRELRSILDGMDGWAETAANSSFGRVAHGG